MRSPSPSRPMGAAGREGRGLHAFACLTAAATFVLIIAGGLVTSTGSGLAVPDWPLSYGMVMPPMVGGVRFEHTHRLLAGTVAILMLVLMVWLLRREPRPWVRRLGVAAFATVILQALLGGLTVILLLPTLISAAHATLAQTFFSITVLLVIVTSPRWRQETPVGTAPAKPSGGASGTALSSAQASAARGTVVPSTPVSSASPGATAILAAAAFVAVYVQLIIGAVMRHMDAGLAIPDFPLAFGRLLPPFWSREIAIHFAHRIGALVVFSIIATLVVALRRDPAKRHHALAAMLSVLVPAQVGLGALTVLTRKDVGIATAHVATGAAILVTCLVIAVRLWRPVIEAAVARRRGLSDAAPAAGRGGVIAPADLESDRA